MRRLLDQRSTRRSVGTDADSREPPAAVLQDYQAVEELERDGPNHEQVERCDPSGMIAQKGEVLQL